MLPLQPTEVPGVYRRKQSVDTLAEARVIRLQRDGAARASARVRNAARSSTMRDPRAAAAGELVTDSSPGQGPA